MSDRLKILHVVPTLKKDGAEVQLAELFKEIDNVQIELFTFDMYKNGDSISDNLENINIYSKSSIKSIFFLNKIIKNNNYDIIHSHLPKSDIIIGFLKLFNKGIKQVVSVHAQYGTRKGENKFKYLLINIIWKKILNNSNGVVAISNKINRWLAEDRGINQELISTIYYGVKINDRPYRNKQNNTIGMAARILPWKGWDKVLETAFYLKKLDVNFKLKLAGSDDEGYVKNIKSMIQEYQLEDNIEISNHYSDIDDFFSQLDLFLFLSESEGFGLVVLEAIENNVAVVCSNISPLNEFVANVENCLVDRENTREIANIIKGYFENEQKKLEEVQISQKDFIVQNFSIENTAKSFEKFYINTNNV
tara:strand:- start:2135 stop:3223 length:1089 start_codon:yes stop_codon:yes gene_type:complete